MYFVIYFSVLPPENEIISISCCFVPVPAELSSRSKVIMLVVPNSGYVQRFLFRLLRTHCQDNLRTEMSQNIRARPKTASTRDPGAWRARWDVVDRPLAGPLGEGDAGEIESQISAAYLRESE